MQQSNGAPNGTVDSVARQNIASAVEHHGSGRRSLSESLLVDQYPGSGNVSLRKQFHDEEDTVERVPKISEHDSSSQVNCHVLALPFSCSLPSLVLFINSSTWNLETELSL